MARGSHLLLKTTMLLGQMITGGIVSGFTVTSKQHLKTGPAAEDTLVQHTLVAPSGKVLPEGGEQETGRIAPVQLSIA
jgi:hypothetical protein